MPGVPDSFILGLRRLPTRFTRAQAAHEFPALKESSLTVYLSQLTHSGHLRRVGPKEFEKATPKGTQAVDPQVRRLVHHLENRVTLSALTRSVAWSDNALAPFAHDALTRPFVILEAPRGILRTVRDLLLRDWVVHEVQDRPRLAEVIWRNVTRGSDRPEVFLVSNADLRGTIPSRDGPRIPTVERLFVDALRFKPLNPDLPLRMLETPSFDPREALRIAGSRGDTALAASFLTWAALRDPKLPLLRQLRNEFAHLNLEA